VVKWRCVATCYGNRNEPEIGLDLVKVFEHNGIEVALVERENCMRHAQIGTGRSKPAVSLADLKARNLPPLPRHDRTTASDIVAPHPLMCLDVQTRVAADVS